MINRPKEKEMHWSRKYVIVGSSVLALAAAGAGTAIATGDEGGTTGPGADQAKAAALKIYPGSHANSVERDSENGATWEVEVAKPDGSTVDVRLDQSYRLVVAEADSGDQGGR
jgi:peptidase YpeB-like protein